MVEQHFKKARVMKRTQLDITTWHEVHCGIVINQNDWGAQIYDDQSPFGELSPQLWEFAEWYPWDSRGQKVQMLS